MSVADRAKQFSPFAALKGYEEMIERAGGVVAERKTLSEEQAETLSDCVKSLKKGDLISVEYYKGGKYVTACGMLSSIDIVTGRLTVIKTAIRFEDIYEIRKEE